MPDGPPDDSDSADIDSNPSSDSDTDSGGPVARIREVDGTAGLLRDTLVIVAVVCLIGALAFGISGSWPPFAAVESGSMEPGISIGDLVFVVAEDRFVGDGAVAGTGVVTLETGQETGEERFGQPGDVIVFAPDGDPTATPIIHRAHFWVEEGENWVNTKADEEALNGKECGSIDACPAPHDGFVTKGDANSAYDQVDDRRYAETTVVDPSWIEGKASVRVPWLGHVRLFFESLVASVVASAVFVGGLTAAFERGHR